MKWENVIREFYDFAGQVFHDLSDRVEEYAKMCALYDEVYKLSSRACAECMDDVAKRIAKARQEPFLETYSKIMCEAVKMLAEGKDEASVVWHFESKISSMVSGGRRWLN